MTLPPIPGNSDVGNGGNINGDEGIRELLADDLRELCEVDERLMRQRMGVFNEGEGRVRVALIPDVETMQWHHAREEFAAMELLGRRTEVKGAIVDGGPGRRVWAIWTRMFAEEEWKNKLYILRMVVEGEENFHQAGDERNVKAAATVLAAAQREAGMWPMHAVEVWNPSATILAAAKMIEPDAKHEERESESVTSLMWYGGGSGEDEEVEWVGNEKYAWI